MRNLFFRAVMASIILLQRVALDIVTSSMAPRSTAALKIGSPDQSFSNSVLMLVLLVLSSLLF